MTRGTCISLTFVVVASLALVSLADDAVDGSAARPAETAPVTPLSLSATNGPLRAQLVLDPAQPAIGAPIRLRLTAELDPSAKLAVEWPNVSELVTEALGELVVDVESMRPTADGRGIEGVIRLFDEGEHALPPFAVRAVRPASTGPSELVVEVVIEGAILTIDAGVADDAEPIGALAPLPLMVPEPPFPWMWAGVGAAALVLLAAGAIAFARRTRPAPPSVPVAPPHQRALDALRELSARGLPERGEVETYFVELSEILRHYLEERFGLRAPEQTTEEFLAAVSHTDAGRRAIQAAHRDLLRDFLTRADLVKFARDMPGADECSVAGDGAERFVLDTIPDPPAASLPGAGGAS